MTVAETDPPAPGSTVEFVDARPLLPAELPDLGDGPTVQLWPHRHGTDAMFLALLRRTLSRSRAARPWLDAVDAGTGSYTDA